MEDLLGFGKLGVKVLEMLGRATGYIFEPQHIKRVAAATAEAAKKASEVAPEGSLITIDGDHVTIQTGSQKTILPNQIANLVKAELHKQENVDAIVGKALDALKKKDQEAEVDLQEDWINHFMEDAKLVSDDEMQDIWAEILTQQSLQKGSYSIRSMTVLSSLSKEEAKIFTECCKNSFGLREERFLLNFTTMQLDYGINLMQLMQMADAGLINDSGKNLSFTERHPLDFVKDDLCFHVVPTTNRSLSINLFTMVGAELSKLVHEKKPFSDEQIKEILSIPKGENVEIYQRIDDWHRQNKPFRTIVG
jgi:hypothetical protein